MAIVKMARATITAFTADRDALLQELQAMGEVHFSNLTENIDGAEFEGLLRPDGASVELIAIREKIDSLAVAIKGLESVEPPSGLLASLNTALPTMNFAEANAKNVSLELEEIVDRVLAHLRQIEQNNEDIALAKEYKRQLRPYQKMTVSEQEIGALRSISHALGTIPKRLEEIFRRELTKTEETIFTPLSMDDKHLYFLLLYTASEKAAVEELLRQLGYNAKSFVANKPIKDLMAEYDDIILELESMNERFRKRLQKIATESLADMKLRAECLRNEYVRMEARENLITGDHAFVGEVYIPWERRSELERILQSRAGDAYVLELEEVERDDAQVEKVPVLLKNNALAQPFEDVVETFATPRYDEIDPTPLVVPWFGACFGFMLGDLGYALVLFLLSTLALRCFKLKTSTKQSLRFFQILSIPSMIIGAMYGSFFALSFPAVISPTDDPNTALVASMVFGVVMLFFALGIQAYMKIRDHDILSLVVDVFSWYLAVIGAIVYLFGGNVGIGEGGRKAGLVIMAIGLVLVLIFSARDESSLGARIAWGAYNVYGASSWIGDIVSYARLAALAMSGGFIGYAVNLIANMVSGNVVGKAAALIIVLIFHPFNIFLSCLSAYVHTLRLIYVEFFGKFFEGGGIPFKRFRAESEYVELQ